MKKILNRLNLPGWDEGGRLGNYVKTVRAGLIEKVIFGQRFGASEGISQVGIWVTRGCLKYLFY